MTHITRSGDASGVTREDRAPLDPAAPVVLGQRQESADVAATASKAASKFVPCSAVLPRLLVPAVEQWVSTTRCRIALDPYGWMQAVHWVVASGCYVPSRSHGPKKMERTAIRTAQLLAELSPCRPGVEYLARRLGVTERTAQYQLDMLREAGLLAYIAKGTRVRGQRAQASEFARVIPVEFDIALGIRTAGEGTGRRVTGLAEAGRAVMAMLGKRASRKVRAARAKSASKNTGKDSVTSSQASTGLVPSQVSQAADGTSAALSRCTPMEGGCCTGLPDGSLQLPPESKLASGDDDRTTPQKQQEQADRPRRRKLNAVGRRYQLAWELIQQVPWLNRAAVARIAWIVRDVADAGWTVNEVLAWLDLRQEPGRVRRPSAFLATRLTGATDLWTDPQARKRAVEAWRDNRRATAARHQEWDGAWQAPRSQHVRNLVAAALLPADPGAGGAAAEPDTAFGLEDLTADEVRQMRMVAEMDPALVWAAISLSGETAARRLYTNALVDRVLRLQSASSRMVVHGTGGQW